MALGSAQSLTEMSALDLPEGKGRPARKADLTAICEPIVSTACYRDSFTCYLTISLVFIFILFSILLFMILTLYIPSRLKMLCFISISGLENQDYGRRVPLR
jgi:hypothetical protein